jgi:putative membrane protein insertion efficiency factor
MVCIFERIVSLPRYGIVGLIRLYQVVSSPFPPSCRFTPSCSAYTLEAVRAHGALKGSWLGAARIVRCQPFSAGGSDPVPEKK